MARNQAPCLILDGRVPRAHGMPPARGKRPLRHDLGRMPRPFRGPAGSGIIASACAARRIEFESKTRSAGPRGED
jgi:hypothetical protein